MLSAWVEDITNVISQGNGVAEVLKGDNAGTRPTVKTVRHMQRNNYDNLFANLCLLDDGLTSRC